VARLRLAQQSAAIMPAASPATDYARVADAIAWLRAHRREQPGFAALARHMHLSETHLQRLFTRWAGISPKRCLQSLTLARASSTRRARRAARAVTERQQFPAPDLAGAAGDPARPACQLRRAGRGHRQTARGAHGRQRRGGQSAGGADSLPSRHTRRRHAQPLPLGATRKTAIQLWELGGDG
jgi:AraC-like DNA-binding protein